MSKIFIDESGIIGFNKILIFLICTQIVYKIVSILETSVNFSFDANKYFNDSEPWAIKKKDPKRMNSILYTITQQIKNISILLNPIIPNSTKKILNTMNIKDSEIKISNIFNSNLFDHNKELKNLEILFTKIDNDN